MAELNQLEATMRITTLAQFVVSVEMMQEPDREEAARRDEDPPVVVVGTVEVIEGGRNGIVPREIEEQERIILLNLTRPPIK